MSRRLDEEARSYLLDDIRLRNFVDRLATRGKRKTVPISDIWSAFTSVYEDLPSGAERRFWLLAVLEELEASEEILLPVRHGKQWDRTSDILLPTKISLCAFEQPQQKDNWRTFAWHPRLQWVLSRRHLIPSHFEFGS